MSARRGRSAGGRADHAGGHGPRGDEADEPSAPALPRAHPSAEIFADFKDFSFFRIEPTGAHLVAGFGRIIDLSPDEFLTDISDADALIGSRAGAIEHMNADHRDAMHLYATRLLGADGRDWRCTGCDPEGIDMQAGAQTLRLDFPRRDCHSCRTAAG